MEERGYTKKERTENQHQVNQKWISHGRVQLNNSPFELHSKALTFARDYKLRQHNVVQRTFKFVPIAKLHEGTEVLQVKLKLLLPAPQVTPDRLNTNPFSSIPCLWVCFVLLIILKALM